MIAHGIKSFFLREFVKAHWPKAFEKNPASPRLLGFAVAFAGLANAGVASAKGPEASGPYRFECRLAMLIQPQNQVTDFTPVTISFVADKGALRDIHVVDAGGILYPGGNFRFVHKPDAISMEAVEMPAERPGRWSGTVEKKMFKLKLASGPLEEAVTMGIGRSPVKSSGRHGLIWNASHQPEGSPRPISGSGVGNCALGQAQGNSK